MRKIKVKAHGKVNLFLEVLGKRSDGYHEIKTVLQSIELSDTLIFTSSKKIEIRYSSSFKIPPDQDLIKKAIELLKRETGVAENVKIEVEKEIPLGAGLGGGSADAAACLVALNQLWDLNLPLSYLEKMGVDLGADVPFFFHGGTMLAEGKGEKLKALPALPFCYLLIAKPAFSISTAEAYSRLNQFERTPKKISSMVTALTKGDLESIAASLYNAFEVPVFKWHPELEKLKAKAIQSGAKGSLLTGSGSAIFALADSYKACRKISQHLKDNKILVIVTSSYPRSLDILN